MRAGKFILRGQNSVDMYEILSKNNPLTAGEVAKKMHIPLLLARSRLSLAVKTGWLKVIKIPSKHLRQHEPYRYTISDEAKN